MEKKFAEKSLLEAGNNVNQARMSDLENKLSLILKENEALNAIVRNKTNEKQRQEEM